MANGELVKKINVEFGIRGEKYSELFRPMGITSTRDGKFILTTDKNTKQVTIFKVKNELEFRYQRKIMAENRFEYPYGIATDSLKRIIFTDSELHCVFIYSFEGKFQLKFGQSGNGPNDLRNPTAIDIDDRDRILVSDTSNNRIQLYNLGGYHLMTFSSQDLGVNLYYPIGAAFGKNNNIYIPEKNAVIITNTLIRDNIKMIGNNLLGDERLVNIVGIIEDEECNLIVANHKHKVLKFNRTGDLVSIYRLEGLGESKIPILSSICKLPNGNILLVDCNNHKLLLIN